MNEEQKKLMTSWRTIVMVLHELGYDVLYTDEISTVATQIRKDLGMK